VLSYLTGGHIVWMSLLCFNLYLALRATANKQVNCMEQSPFVVTQISRLLWNPKVRCRVHKRPPLVPILSRIAPIHTFTSYFPKIQSNIIFPHMRWSPAWSLYFGFSDTKFYMHFLSLPCGLHASPISTLLHLTALVIFDEACKLQKFLLWGLFRLPATSSLSQVHIFSAPCCQNTVIRR